MHYVDLPEAARLLHVSVPGVGLLVERGELERVDTAIGPLIPLASIDTFARTTYAAAVAKVTRTD
jgi:hypothetical protein